jgi:hypothetical protein
MTQMVEREHLTQALKDLGCGWQEGGRLGFLGPRVDIKVKDHNLGFRKAGAAYAMVTVGEGTKQRQFLQQMTQRYAYYVARAKLEEQGFTLVDEEVQEGERIHLVLRRMV